MLDWNIIRDRATKGAPAPPRRDERSPAKWREVLDPLVFQVTRQAATERPFSSEMCGLFAEGRYACACCATVLFDATEKFDSGTGWPSFTQPLDDTTVGYVQDTAHGMVRIEATCAVCDAHLGHVFPDGPAPTGLRYCMNAAALQKV